MEFQWTAVDYGYNCNPFQAEEPILGNLDIWFDYADMNYDTHHEVRIVDFNTFVSNVGGTQNASSKCPRRSFDVVISFSIF